MRIGFDLDNVFIATPPFIPPNLIERLYGRRTNGKLEYRIPSKREQVIRFLTHIPPLRPAITKNVEVLKKMTGNENQLFLISSRYRFLKPLTTRIIKKHKFDKFFHELYFNNDNKQPHIFKEELLKKLRIDMFIDDDLHLLKYVASKNNTIKLYWLNKKVNKKLSNSIRGITDLAELLNH